MSFLIDGPWLFALGDAYGRHEPEDAPDAQAAVLGTATIATFWGVSVPLYLNMRWTEPIWRRCRARSGRDWMINSGALKIDETRVGPRGHALSAAIFLTYPLWLAAGYSRGRRARRRGDADRQ